MIQNSIFFVSGVVSLYAIERLDFHEEQLIYQQVIGNSMSDRNPVLFEVPADYCA